MALKLLPERELAARAGFERAEAATFQRARLPTARHTPSNLSDDMTPNPFLALFLLGLGFLLLLYLAVRWRAPLLRRQLQIEALLASTYEELARVSTETPDPPSYQALLNRRQRQAGRIRRLVIARYAALLCLAGVAAAAFGLLDVTYLFYGLIAVTAAVLSARFELRRVALAQGKIGRAATDIELAERALREINTIVAGPEPGGEAATAAA